MEEEEKIWEATGNPGTREREAGGACAAGFRDEELGILLLSARCFAFRASGIGKGSAFWLAQLVFKAALGLEDSSIGRARGTRGRRPGEEPLVFGVLWVLV